MRRLSPHYSHCSTKHHNTVHHKTSIRLLSHNLKALHSTPHPLHPTHSHSLSTAQHNRPLLTSLGTGPGCPSPRGPALGQGYQSRCPVLGIKHPLSQTERQTDRQPDRQTVLTPHLTCTSTPAQVHTCKTHTPQHRHALPNPTLEWS